MLTKLCLSASRHPDVLVRIVGTLPLIAQKAPINSELLLKKWAATYADEALLVSIPTS